MIYVYINYPNPHAMIHFNTQCPWVHRANVPATSRREMEIRLDNLSSILKRFKDQEVDFTAEAGENGLWLNIDLSDKALEIAVATHIVEVLGERYTPLARVSLQTHCTL